MVTPLQKAQSRAQDAYRRIQDKPTVLIFRKPQPPNRPLRLPAQTVRVEIDNRASMMTSAAGSAPRLGVVVFGIRSHPSLPDTDMAEGYLFMLDGDEYRIEDVLLGFGQIQGTGVRTG